MIEITYKINPEIDKTKYEIGEWTNEPDYMEWNCPISGYKSFIRRSFKMHLCGYVELKPDHPFYIFSRSSIEDIISVHGGITYHEFDENSKLIGFDTMHCFDKKFSTLHELKTISNWRSIQEVSENSYRNIDYMFKEVLNLSLQCFCFDRRKYIELL